MGLDRGRARVDPQDHGQQLGLDHPQAQQPVGHLRRDPGPAPAPARPPVHGSTVPGRPGPVVVLGLLILAGGLLTGYREEAGALAMATIVTSALVAYVRIGGRPDPDREGR